MMRRQPLDLLDASQQCGVERSVRVVIEVMLQVHMTEAEAARDFHAVLERVRDGAEVVIERDQRPVAVIRTPAVKGRLLSECIALAEARGSAVTPDA
jgi:antitoxin (DNA-binding transcriptional repressor) of toxin-antitoxin stability system